MLKTNQKHPCVSEPRRLRSYFYKNKSVTIGRGQQLTRAIRIPGSFDTTATPASFNTTAKSTDVRSYFYIYIYKNNYKNTQKRSKVETESLLIQED
jgi:hypothetical protein